MKRRIRTANEDLRGLLLLGGVILVFLLMIWWETEKNPQSLPLGIGMMVLLVGILAWMVYRYWSYQQFRKRTIRYGTKLTGTIVGMEVLGTDSWVPQGGETRGGHYRYILSVRIDNPENGSSFTINSEPYRWPVANKLASPEVTVYRDESGWKYILDDFILKRSSEEPGIFDNAYEEDLTAENDSDPTLIPLNPNGAIIYPKACELGGPVISMIFSLCWVFGVLQVGLTGERFGKLFIFLAFGAFFLAIQVKAVIEVLRRRKRYREILASAPARPGRIVSVTQKSWQERRLGGRGSARFIQVVCYYLTVEVREKNGSVYTFESEAYSKPIHEQLHSTEVNVYFYQNGWKRLISDFQLRGSQEPGADILWEGNRGPSRNPHIYALRFFLVLGLYFCCISCLQKFFSFCSRKFSGFWLISLQKFSGFLPCESHLSVLS